MRAQGYTVIVLAAGWIMVIGVMYWVLLGFMQPSSSGTFGANLCIAFGGPILLLIGSLLSVGNLAPRIAVLSLALGAIQFSIVFGYQIISGTRVPQGGAPPAYLVYAVLTVAVVLTDLAVIRLMRSLSHRSTSVKEQVQR